MEVASLVATSWEGPSLEEGSSSCVEPSKGEAFPLDRVPFPLEEAYPLGQVPFPLEVAFLPLVEASCRQLACPFVALEHRQLLAEQLACSSLDSELPDFSSSQFSRSPMGALMA